MRLNKTGSECQLNAAPFSWLEYLPPRREVQVSRPLHRSEIRPSPTKGWPKASGYLESLEPTHFGGTTAVISSDVRINSSSTVSNPWTRKLVDCFNIFQICKVYPHSPHQMANKWWPYPCYWVKNIPLASLRKPPNLRGPVGGWNAILSS